MATFKYIAVNKNQESINGTLEASDKSAVMASLLKQGLRPISITETKSSGKSGFLNLNFKGRVKSEDIVMLTRQLSAMISAGVPILRSLNSLAAHAESKPLKEILENVSKDIEGGMSLADALEQHPTVFNNVYVNMVRAGEAAGILDDILKRLALQQEKASSIKKKIKSSMTYPMVLIFITIAAFFGLMIFVIPTIGKTIKDLGGEDAKLPALTEFMLGLSSFILNWWYIIIPGIIGVVFLTIKYIKTDKGRRQFHKLLLKIPAIRGIVQKIAVARFARTFSALMGAGVAVLESLSVTARAIGNTVYEEALMNAAQEVTNGKQLSKVIEEYEDLFPAITAQMLSVGEETGQTDKVLVRVAEFYEEEVDAAIGSISSIIEPVMIVIMGGMVGLIAASVMGPIAGMANNIKG